MGLRLAYGWYEVKQLPREALVAEFQQETGNIASSLVRGRGYSSPFGRESGPTASVTPVYPLLIAGIFRIFGIETVPAFFASVFMNFVFSAATCVPIFYAGKRIGGTGLASGAAWAWAFFPNAIILPFNWIWNTSLSALLVATLVWATLLLAKSERWHDWCGYGLLWGFTLMTDPTIGSLLPFWLAWLAYRGAGPARERFGRPALAAAIAVLCCVPWTVRNYLAFHEFVPSRSTLGLELYVGNNENYDDVHPRVWPFLITREREIYRYFRVGEMPFMHEEMRKALHFIFSHPRVEVRLWRERIVLYWMGTLTPLRDFLDTDSLLLRAVSVCNLLALLGTLGGIAVLYGKRSDYAFPLSVCPVIFPIVFYATHSTLRYRHPIDPVIVLLAASAVVLPWRAKMTGAKKGS